MTDSRVAGDLVLDGPGVRALPVRIDGTHRDVRVRLASGRLVARTSRASLRRVGESLARTGTVVRVYAGPFPLLRLGDARRPVRVHASGALWSLLTVPARRVGDALRTLRRGGSHG